MAGARAVAASLSPARVTAFFAGFEALLAGGGLGFAAGVRSDFAASFEVFERRPVRILDDGFARLAGMNSVPSFAADPIRFS